MSAHTVFIDGEQGTTGLRVRERLAGREDIRLVTLPEGERKSLPARLGAARSADVSILCLPDDASRELVAALGDDGRVIDASTAHRTDKRFEYGFPELDEGAAERIAASNRVAVPGCHACGCIALIKPLVDEGLLSPDAPLALTSLTGYSGGGKSMIASYEDAARPAELHAPRPYAVGQSHKHLPEIVSVCGISAPPVFQPIVCDFFSGMLTSLPLPSGLLNKPCGVEELREVYARRYSGAKLISTAPVNAEGSIDSVRLSGFDCMEIMVTGNDERMMVYARFDNLGKGASGAAIQCMNLMLGLDMTEGLRIWTK